MLPLEESCKNTLYYKTEEGNYKELNAFSKMSEGFRLVSTGISEVAKQFINELTNAKKELSFSFKIKHISRKRFKKLLMSYGWQRNEAETIAKKVFLRNKYYSLFDLCFYQNRLLIRRKK